MNGQTIVRPLMEWSQSLKELLFRIICFLRVPIRRTRRKKVGQVLRAADDGKAAVHADDLPVMYDAFSDARNETTSPISSAYPLRRSGINLGELR